MNEGNILVTGNAPEAVVAPKQQKAGAERDAMRSTQHEQMREMLDNAGQLENPKGATPKLQAGAEQQPLETTKLNEKYGTQVQATFQQNAQMLNQIRAEVASIQQYMNSQELHALNVTDPGLAAWNRLQAGERFNQLIAMGTEIDRNMQGLQNTVNMEFDAAFRRDITRLIPEWGKSPETMMTTSWHASSPRSHSVCLGPWLA